MRLSGLVLAAALAFGPSPAYAHAILLSSQPSDRTVLPQSPGAVSLTFNEPVQLTLLQLVRSDGTAIRANEEWGLTSKIEWTLPETLANGGWLLSYSVISTDSHTVSGTIRMAVGEGNVRFAELQSATDGLTEFPRFLMLLGALLGVGLLLARAVLRPRPSRIVHMLLVGAVLAAATGSAWFIYATAEAAGGGGTALGAALRILGPGAAIVTAGLVAGVAFAFLGFGLVAALCGVVALVGLGLSGHTAGAPPDWISRPAHLIHTSAAALWLGSLIVLLWRRQGMPAGAPAETDNGAAVVLPRFSRLAPWMVGLLLLAGTAMVVVQGGTIQALVTSRYGLLLAVKIGLVALLLGFAAYNRWRLTRPVLSGDGGAESRLRQSIWVELALFAGILGTTALLGATVPPRAYVASEQTCGVDGPVTLSGRDIGLDVALTMESACSGPNTITISMAWNDGRPLSVQEVMLRFSLPDLNIEPFDVYLERVGDGVFAITGYDLPLPGEWRVESRILLDEFTLRRVVFRAALQSL